MEPAFTDFLLRSWESFRNSLGTTNLGFIAPLIASVLSIVLTLIFVVREQGIAGLKLHWKQDARVGLLVLLIVTVLVYGVIFLYDGILGTIYSEEQTAARLAQQNRELSEQLERKRHSLDTSRGSRIGRDDIDLREAVFSPQYQRLCGRNESQSCC